MVVTASMAVPYGIGRVMCAGRATPTTISTGDEWRPRDARRPAPPSLARSPRRPAAAVRSSLSLSLRGTRPRTSLASNLTFPYSSSFFLILGVLSNDDTLLLRHAPLVRRRDPRPAGGAASRMKSGLGLRARPPSVAGWGRSVKRRTLVPCALAHPERPSEPPATRPKMQASVLKREALPRWPHTPPLSSSLLGLPTHPNNRARARASSPSLPPILTTSRHYKTHQ